jgi:hypothetical protein
VCSSDLITAEWTAQGLHRAVTDPKLDKAVIHVPNDLPFAEIVAILDALHAPDELATLPSTSPSPPTSAASQK